MNPQKPTPNLAQRTASYDDMEWVIPKPNGIDDALWDELSPKQKLLVKTHPRARAMYMAERNLND